MEKADKTLHPLQSDAWETFRRTMGIDAVRIHGLLVTFHRIPGTQWTIGYVPKGPEPNRDMVTALTALGRQKRAVFIQLEPDVLAKNGTATRYGKLSLAPSHHPLFTKYTFVLDLTKSDEALRAAMHPKTRYNLKIAEKHGVTVQEDNSVEAFRTYLALSSETTGRQGFYAHSPAYHETMWRIMHKSGIAHLFTARYQGEVLAAWVIFAAGDTVYYPYGASSRTHREVMAPTLMLWEIARWAKARGYKKFDLWGAMGPNPDTRDAWYGFHRFKQGFNPDLKESAGSYDLIIRPLLYRLYTVADTLRWALLRMRAALRR